MRGDGRGLIWFYLLLIASLFTSGCKTWSYTAKHRGIRTILYNPTIVPVEHIDLDSPFFAPKRSFATNEQPAIVIAGIFGRCRLELIDLQTGKTIATKRVSLNWSSVTIQPLEIQKSGEYKAYFDFPDNERNAFRFSVDRTSSETNRIPTNSPSAEPFALKILKLGLNPQKASKNYDALFATSVQQSWYSLVDNAHWDNLRGTVALRFRLNSNGQVSDFRVVKNTADNAGASLCEQAVTKLSPKPWPDALRKEIGKDFREVTFNFYY